MTDNKETIGRTVDEDYRRFHLHVPEDTRQRIIDTLLKGKETPDREREKWNRRRERQQRDIGN